MNILNKDKLYLQNNRIPCKRTSLVAADMKGYVMKHVRQTAVVLLGVARGGEWLIIHIKYEVFTFVISVF